MMLAHKIVNQVNGQFGVIDDLTNSPVWF